ncbi:MAG: hypothetical protein ACSLEL_00510 [Candidatus Malihini olakiniferum]
MKKQGLNFILAFDTSAEDIAIVNKIHEQCQQKPNISLAGKHIYSNWLY